MLKPLSKHHRLAKIANFFKQSKFWKMSFVYFFLLLIWIWQYCLSPLIPKSCRFYPSCSCYSQEALKKYGLIKGLQMTIKRILKCGPWHKGGYDPVP